MLTILAAVVVLGLLIFVHELGHFITAKWVDIEVPRFSIGFGPKIFGFRRGETEYVLSALPLGGYVKMAGMEELEAIEGTTIVVPADSPDAPAGPAQPVTAAEEARLRGPRDFESKSLPARVLVISAGVLMNLIFAFFLFSVIGMVWGVPYVAPAVVGNVAEELLPPGAEPLARIPRGTRIVAVGNQAIKDSEDLRMELSIARPGPLEIHVQNGPPVTITVPRGDSLRSVLATAVVPETPVEPVISVVGKDSPAAQAGMKAGDRIVSAANEPVASWQQFVAVIDAHPGEPVPVVVQRGEDRIPVTVVPLVRTLPDGFRYGRIGVNGPPEALNAPRRETNLANAIVYGASETGRWVKLTAGFLGGIFTGRHSARSIGGPIMIVQISGQQARAGFQSFLHFMALLSVNLAVLNLLPIPVLDGGHLLFLGIEAVRGRALSMQQRLRWSQVGFMVLLAIMVFAIGNDLLRLVGL
jgi:regulator of sigma E protease